MKMLREICKLLVMGAMLSGPVQAQQPLPLTVFAAASLKTALDEVVRDWAEPVVISYSGSGTIARQVAYGAPADVVILANISWMGWLQQQGGLASEPRALLSNRLVVIAPKEAKMPATGITSDLATIRKYLGTGRLAIGQTAAVPAGIYGKQWLQAAGLWQALSPRLAETENVRAALALVARNETSLGIVYASDAMADPRVTVVYDIPAGLHGEIIYPAAVTAGAAQAQAAKFLDYLASDPAQKLFQAHGFLAPPVGS